MNVTHRSLLATSLVLFAACGGGGGGGSKSAPVFGLEGPQAMSVVTADDEGPTSSTFPPDSSYVQDEVSLHVYDPSMESLGTVNQILCITSLTAYSDMVNEGAYLALVDESLCEDGGGDDDSQGQSAGGVAEYEIFTVRSSRAKADGNQLVHFWVPSDGPGNIFAKMILREGVTDSNPFGDFTLGWAAGETFADVTNPEMFGVLETIDAQTGEIGFAFYENQGDVDQPHAFGESSRRGAVTVEMTSDQTRGAARIRDAERGDWGSGDTGKVETDWELVYNETHVKRREIDEFGNPGPVTTLSRENYDDRVWRYTLYHNQGVDLGARVEVDSGFGFRTGDGEYGYVGYWGLWAPDDVTVADGDTVTRDDGSEFDGEAYTVVRAPGKLIRRAQETMDLADLTGQIFEWWDDAGNFLVDHDGVDFRKIAEMNFGTGEWDDVIPPIAIDVAAEGGFLDMWSKTLGGPVAYVDGDAVITYFEETFVDGDHPLMAGAVNGYVQLFGLVDCLDAELLGADVEAGDIYLPNAPDTLPANANVYRLGAADLTLYYDPNRDATVLEQVGLATGEEPTSGPYTWGMRSGPLVTDLAGLTDVWDIWSVAEYYVYETGHNDWNQYAGVKDSLGAFASFDPPLQVLYTHTTANDRNDDATYDGVNFVLGYGGAGDLWGIPHDEVDLTGDGNPDRWYPQFSLADGVTMGPTGVEYVVKAVEIERTLQEDPGGAPGLDIANAAALALPDDSNYVTPDNGDVPEITDAPKVINGEVVSD